MRPHTMLGHRYRMEQRIAAGGMGEVWRATDTKLGRTVAVKVLHPALADDPEFRQRFTQEALTVARLRARGVVSLYDACEEPGEDGSVFCYLVMEHVPGRSLSQVLKARGRLPVEQTLRLVSEVADALDAAHRVGIVHRDVKPGNILVGPDGQVTLVDFGIAQARGQARLTATGMVVGTFSYASPEQLLGRELTPASDVYSLGVVAYECLAGALPYTDASPAAAIHAQLSDAPPPPPPAPAPVAQVVLRALVKDPRGRFPSAAEFARACRDVRTRAGSGTTGFGGQPTARFNGQLAAGHGGPATAGFGGQPRTAQVAAGFSGPSTGTRGAAGHGTSYGTSHGAAGTLIAGRAAALPPRYQDQAEPVPFDPAPPNRNRRAMLAAVAAVAVVFGVVTTVVAWRITGDDDGTTAAGATPPTATVTSTPSPARSTPSGATRTSSAPKPQEPPPSTEVPGEAMLRDGDLPGDFDFTGTDVRGDWVFAATSRQCPYGETFDVAVSDSAGRSFEDGDETIRQKVTRYTQAGGAGEGPGERAFRLIRERAESCPSDTGISVADSDFAGDDSLLVEVVHGERGDGDDDSTYIFVRQGDLVAEIWWKGDPDSEAARRIAKRAADRLCAGTHAC